MLIDTIRNDMLIARKSKDTATSAILQTVVAEIDRMNGMGNGTVDEQKIISILKKFSKESKSNAELARNSGRNSDADSFDREAVILDKYIPSTMTYEQVYEALKNHVCKGMNKGQAMKIAMPMLRSKAEGKDISAAVDSLLNG